VPIDPHLAGTPEDWLEARHKAGALTRREQEVLSLMAAGLPNKELCEALDLSPRTVECHRLRMKAKLGVSTVGGLVRIAIYAALAESSGGR
jgi:DNA-binding CsgD family transcriptional regulator